MNVRNLIAPILALGTIAVLAAPSMAQEHHPMSVNHRLERQDARIHEGVKTHELNKYEAARLHARDRRIHVAEHRDRRYHGGHLTAAERARLEHRLNHDSHSIHHDKHPYGKP